MWMLNLLVKQTARWAKRHGYGYLDFTYIKEDYIRIAVKDDIHDKGYIVDKYTFDGGKKWRTNTTTVQSTSR